MQNRNIIVAHLAVAAAYCIFGFNIIITKFLSNEAHISPMGLMTVRAGGATLIFWIMSLFTPKEHVPGKDLAQIFIASMLGLFLTQICFLKAITVITPLDCSIVTTLSPIFTMLIAAVAIKEPITLKKAGGVLLSFAGIIAIILMSHHATSEIVSSDPWGIVLMLGNGFFFALYLGIFRPLISKYSVITFMKWMFLFTFIINISINADEFLTLDYSQFSATYWTGLAFIVIFSTVIAYFLIPIGQKALRPTVVSLYSYLQPIIASLISIYLGMDHITWQKIVAITVVISGVVMVNRSRARNQG